ncbi:MAG TPA: hypothetical protein ENL03_03550, partial [Phycisphaerae bacterium]|nr:hypothetical protein [Phycisphaerae bacterium]
MNHFNPDYRQLTDHIEAAELAYSTAEAHGILVGMLCGGSSNWQRVLLEDAAPDAIATRECISELEKLFLFTAEELRSGQIPLQLMLPDEHASIAQRAAAIRDWSQGFLFGFGLGGQQESQLMNGDIGEALRDFTEIARMNIEDFGELQE